MWSCQPSQIVAAVDFGDASKRALTVAGTLARRFAAALQVLHVETFEAPAYFTRDQVKVLERELKAARTLADRHVVSFAAPLVDVPFDVRVIDGPAADSIVEVGRSADLIVMGTHGRRGPSRWWLGSVAGRVLAETSTPLLVVRAGHDDRPVEDVFKRPLMVAAPEVFEGDALRLAGGLASAFGGAVAPRAATCEADIAREREATLIVIAKQPQPSGWFGVPEERLLRMCSLPMLFVPSRSLTR